MFDAADWMTDGERYDLANQARLRSMADVMQLRYDFQASGAFVNELRYEWRPVPARFVRLAFGLRYEAV